MRSGSFRVGDIVITDLIEVDRFEWHVRGSLPAARDDEIARYAAELDPRLLTRTGALALTIRTYLVRASGLRILVDTGFGNQKHRPGSPIGHMLNGPFLEQLRQADTLPEKVDYVFCTHLHRDHVGWNTILIDGRWQPTFPKARYLFPRADWMYWSGVPVGTYGRDAIDDSVSPVFAAGLAELVDPGMRICDGVEVVPLHGHTPGHSGLLLASGAASAIMTGDLMHHPVQVREPSWVHRYDVGPAEARRQRVSFLARFADTGTLVLMAHSPVGAGGQVLRGRWAYQFDLAP